MKRLLLIPIAFFFFLSCEKEEIIKIQENDNKGKPLKASSMTSAQLLLNSIDVGDYSTICRGQIMLSTGIVGSFYVWQKTDQAGITTNIGSSASIILTPTENVVKYNVYVNKNGVIYYDELTLTINNLPIVNSFPLTSFGYEGSYIILKATENPLPSHTYQWYMDNDNTPLSNNSYFIGTTTYQLNILTSSILIGHKFYCKVIASYGCYSYTNQTTLQLVDILNASSIQDLPLNFFRTDQVYKNNYIHLQQKSGECSWTSYVLCAGAIAKGKGYSYDVNYNKITTVKNWCGNSYIERLRDYAQQVDNTFLGNTYLSKESKTSSGRFSTIKQMLNTINLYKSPFLAIITSNGIGHYVVVWSIDWKQSETNSIVYYTDPLDLPKTTFDLQVKSMNMSDFLDKMGPLNNDVSSYCCLLLR